MGIIESRIDVGSEVYRKNFEKMAARVADLKAALKQARLIKGDAWVKLLATGKLEKKLMREMILSEGVRTDRWKYIRYTEGEPPVEQLFDLEADPLEQKDLAAVPAYTETLSALRSRCEGYRASLR